MVHTAHIFIEQSLELQGKMRLTGAKNAVLVVMASLILTQGKSTLRNVPRSDDVMCMIDLLTSLGAQVVFHEEDNVLEVDTTGVNKFKVSPELMKKMRASILVMGPLLARFGSADIAQPGGCVIGARPIDYHIANFIRMGVNVETHGEFLIARASRLQANKLVLEYPSVGATENLMMAASLTPGVTRIVNAALEPEVIDLITVLTQMGARINILPPATIEIEGVQNLRPVDHTIINDRLETGALLLAAAITGGQIDLPQAPAFALDVFLMKLNDMGHIIDVGSNGIGINLKATKQPKTVSFKTAPYPGFPTDLQAPMLAAQCIAEGTSIIEETVFENRLLHVRELQKMGAQIKVEHNKAIITGVDELYGTQVIATDIRASCALVLAGFVAKGTTIMAGVHHWKRGYEALEQKLSQLGARIELREIMDTESAAYREMELLKQLQV
jgi:UDP-N-acetylglucosamine 1-carboxyvinyltransferase